MSHLPARGASGRDDGETCVRASATYAPGRDARTRCQDVTDLSVLDEGGAPTMRALRNEEVGKVAWAQRLVKTIA